VTEKNGAHAFGWAFGEHEKHVQPTVDPSIWLIAKFELMPKAYAMKAEATSDVIAAELTNVLDPVHANVVFGMDVIYEVVPLFWVMETLVTPGSP